MDRGIPIRSLSRGIAVLKAINLNGSMTIMEICEACAMPYATTSRIVQTLVFEGLIARDPGRKRYRATGLIPPPAQGLTGSRRPAPARRPPLLSSGTRRRSNGQDCDRTDEP